MTPKKKPVHFQADLQRLEHRKIYLNIGHLDLGEYELLIVHHNKVITKTVFKKS